jgi:hypothetical protein
VTCSRRSAPSGVQAQARDERDQDDDGAPAPSSVERHWRVTPTARTTVSASTNSTAEATKLARMVATMTLISLLPYWGRAAATGAPGRVSAIGGGSTCR